MSPDSAERPVVKRAVPASDFQAHSRRETALTALLIFVAAFVVRVLFISVHVAHEPERWSHSAPLAQAEMGNIAINLYQGRGFSSPFEMGSTPTAWLCPLVPFLWALVMSYLHEATGYTARILAYINAVPSALSVSIYWLTARHVCRRTAAFTRSTSILVAVLFCIWPESLVALPDLWYYAWQEFGTALVVLLAMMWIDRPSFGSAIPLGLAGGLLALINVTPLPILAVAFLLPVLTDHQRRAQIIRSAALGAALAFLIVFPWLIRNERTLGAIVPLRSNGGFQHWEGNNPNGCIRETGTSSHPFILASELLRYRQLGETQYCRRRLHDSLAYMRAHPLQTILRTGQRAYVMWLTDIFDQWSWDQVKWWQQGFHSIYRTLAVSLAAWALVLMMVWALLSRRLATLPYKALFIGIIFFLPFPYYFTLAENDYSQILRSWLLLLTILAFSADFRPRRSPANQPLTPHPSAPAPI